ncbi:MAG TPA: hypothetical protein PLU37_01490 [Chitinophagaceae bacterium]|nr:hypothetical protein [Chitinophagaceae bacterium]MCB9055996.1 hypothetical protein [Chitinophagales bacterium]HPG10172.1 hypothetical protein [Chitinophagaceae bacterium]HRX93239.1 hypothetical protein [Chitinophagaceae bacterium]
MNKSLLFLLIIISSHVSAQKVDSIYFHLYTDSLKKGQHNYINIDGKLANGKWLPLTDKHISFSCTSATFSGNELIIPEDFKEKKVTVKAVLKSDPAVRKEITIWIKQNPDPPLPRRQDMMPNRRS